MHGMRTSDLYGVSCMVIEMEKDIVLSRQFHNGNKLSFITFISPPRVSQCAVIVVNITVTNKVLLPIHNQFGKMYSSHILSYGQTSCLISIAELAILYNSQL